MFNFETFVNKYGTSFTVYEELDYFIVVVDDETYMVNTVADVQEFIQYYNYYA